MSTRFVNTKEKTKTDVTQRLKVSESTETRGSLKNQHQYEV